jgi:hypothetical protein
MKRLVGSLLLIVCLSFPVLAGHVPIGGIGWCECDDPRSHTLNMQTEEDQPLDILSLGFEAVLLYLKARA